MLDQLTEVGSESRAIVLNLKESLAYWSNIMRWMMRKWLHRVPAAAGPKSERQVEEFRSGGAGFLFGEHSDCGPSTFHFRAKLFRRKHLSPLSSKTEMPSRLEKLLLRASLQCFVDKFCVAAAGDCSYHSIHVPKCPSKLCSALIDPNFEVRPRNPRCGG